MQSVHTATTTLPATRILAVIGSRFVENPGARLHSNWQCDLVTDKPAPLPFNDIGFTVRENLELATLLCRQHEDYVVKGTAVFDGRTEQRYEAWARRFFWEREPTREHFAVELRILREGVPQAIERFEYHPDLGVVAITKPSSQRFASLMGIAAH